jgi:hypothetical protein
VKADDVRRTDAVASLSLLGDLLQRRKIYCQQCGGCGYGGSGGDSGEGGCSGGEGYGVDCGCATWRGGGGKFMLDIYKQFHREFVCFYFQYEEIF